MNFPEIKFVFFDFGKVIVEFDHEQSCRNLMQWCDASAESVHTALYKSGLQDEYEVGAVTSEQFAEKLNDALNMSLSTEQICLAISDIFSFNRSIMPLITQLRLAGVPIGILSNTCEAHWQFVTERWPLIDKYFLPERRVLSYEIGAAKPDPEIYNRAVEVAGCDAENIFFLDDLPDNVAGATTANLQAEVYQSTGQILKCLGQRGLKINL